MTRYDDWKLGYPKHYDAERCYQCRDNEVDDPDAICAECQMANAEYLEDHSDEAMEAQERRHRFLGGLE